MGDIQTLDYILLGIMLIAMLFLFYMIQSMQNTSY